MVAAASSAPSDLANVSHVCRSWHHITLPHLWGNLFLATSPQVVSAFAALGKKGSLCRLVTSLEVKAAFLERGVNAISLFSAVKKASPRMHNLEELRWNRTGAFNDNLLPAFSAHTRTKLQHLEIKGSDSWWPEQSSNLWQLCLPSGAPFPLPSLRSLTVIFPDRLGIKTLISMASKVKLTSLLVRCDFGDHAFRSQDVDELASHIRHLDRLVLVECGGLSGSSVDLLVQCAPKLTALNFERCWGMKAAILPYLAPALAKRLKHLTISPPLRHQETNSYEYSRYATKDLLDAQRIGSSSSAAPPSDQAATQPGAQAPFSLRLMKIAVKKATAMDVGIEVNKGKMLSAKVELATAALRDSAKQRIVTQPLRSDVPKALEDIIRSKHPDVAGHGDLSKLPYGKLPALLVEAAARCRLQLSMTTKSLDQQASSSKTPARSPDTSAASTSQLKKTPVPLKFVPVKKADRKEDNDHRPASAVFDPALLDEPARERADNLNTTLTHLFLCIPASFALAFKLGEVWISMCATPETPYLLSAAPKDMAYLVSGPSPNHPDWACCTSLRHDKTNRSLLESSYAFRLLAAAIVLWVQADGKLDMMSFIAQQAEQPYIPSVRPSFWWANGKPWMRVAKRNVVFKNKDELEAVKLDDDLYGFVDAVDIGPSDPLPALAPHIAAAAGTATAAAPLPPADDAEDDDCYSWSTPTLTRRREQATLQQPSWLQTSRRPGKTSRACLRSELVGQFPPVAKVIRDEYGTSFTYNVGGMATILGRPNPRQNDLSPRPQDAHPHSG